MERYRGKIHTHPPKKYNSFVRVGEEEVEFRFDHRLRKSGHQLENTPFPKSVWVVKIKRDEEVQYSLRFVKPETLKKVIRGIESKVRRGKYTTEQKDLAQGVVTRLDEFVSRPKIEYAEYDG